MSCLLSRESAEEGVSKEDRKNIRKNVHCTARASFCKTQVNSFFHFRHFPVASGQSCPEVLLHYTLGSDSYLE